MPISVRCICCAARRSVRTCAFTSRTAPSASPLAALSPMGASSGITVIWCVALNIAAARVLRSTIDASASLLSISLSCPSTSAMFTNDCTHQG
eukprot:2664736-Amphidinium_carterae.3